MTLLEEFHAFTHWSHPEALKEAAAMMTASTYPTKSLDERIALLRQARNAVQRGAQLAQEPDLKRSCSTAARVLPTEIGRLQVAMTEERIGAALDRVLIFVSTGLGRDVNRFRKEAALIGVGDAPMLVAMACSDT